MNARSPLSGTLAPADAPAWRVLRNLLVVRPDNAGDVVLAGPALRAIRRAAPGARIVLLASPGGAEAAPLLAPWVDDVLVERVLWQDVHGRLPHDPERELRLVERVRERSFDAAVFLTSFSQSPLPPAYVCYLAGVPVRAGQAQEHGGGLLTHRVEPAPFEAHQAERNLHLLEGLGLEPDGHELALEVPPESGARARTLLEREGLDPDAPFALVLPGASADARRYDPARMGEAARRLAPVLPVVVAGSDRERGLVEDVRTAAPAVVAIAGETTVPELAAIVRRSAVVVANNSLGLHLADAFGRSVVATYSGTDLEGQWRPRRARARVLRRTTSCSPCYAFSCPLGTTACLELPPARVAAAALTLLERPAPVEVAA